MVFKQLLITKQPPGCESSIRRLPVVGGIQLISLRRELDFTLLFLATDLDVPVNRHQRRLLHRRICTIETKRLANRPSTELEDLRILMNGEASPAN